jgi:hypothetical protein
MTAQENNQPPRIGRDAQVENETAALKRMRFDTIKAVSFLVDGDRVAINYCFEMTTVTAEASPHMKPSSSRETS